MENKEPLLIIAPLLRTRSTGVSEGVKSFIAGLEEQNISFTHINTVVFKSVNKPGTLTAKRLFEGVLVLSQVILLMPGHKRVYMTLSMSAMGVLRETMVLALARILNKKVIGHLKGGGYEEFVNSSFLRTLATSNLRHYDKIIVLGELLKEQYLRLGYDETKLDVVPNGYLTNEVPEENHNDDHSRPLRLVYLSNLIESKGYREVIEATEVVSRSGVHVKLILAGSVLSIAGENNKRTIEEGSLNDVIEYIGRVDGKRKYDLLKWADVMLLPTSYRWEGQPISLIEGLANGLVLIGTKYRGIPEIIQQGKTGFLIKNVPDIVEVLIELDSNRSLMVEMSRAARELFKQRFTRERHIMNLTRSVMDPAI